MASTIKMSGILGIWYMISQGFIQIHAEFHESLKYFRKLLRIIMHVRTWLIYRFSSLMGIPRVLRYY